MLEEVKRQGGNLCNSTIQHHFVLDDVIGVIDGCKARQLSGMGRDDDLLAWCGQTGLRVPDTHAVRGQGGDVGGSLSRPSGPGKHGQKDTEKKKDTQQVWAWGGGGVNRRVCGGGGGVSAGGCVGGFGRGDSQGGGAYARPTKTTCIPPGGCVSGAGLGKLLVASGCCEAGAADW